MISCVDRVPAVDRTLSFAGARAAPAYGACPFDSETSSFKGKDSRAIARVASRKAPASCPRLTWHPRNDANLDPQRSAAGAGHEHRVNVLAAAPCYRAALQPAKKACRGVHRCRQSVQGKPTRGSPTPPQRRPRVDWRKHFRSAQRTRGQLGIVDQGRWTASTVTCPQDEAGEIGQAVAQGERNPPRGCI
jgi:hypothetical protein